MGKVIKVREVGEPCLEQICETVATIDNELKELIEDMKATLAYGTSLGISAPQIGVNKRVVVIGAKKEAIKYNDAEEIQLTVMINPTWINCGEETDIQYEGCSSVPIVRGKVERFKKIQLKYYDEEFQQVEKEATGFFARLVQHECDHLEGIQFIEKVVGKHPFSTTEMIRKYHKS